jgi:3-hydroxyisobutyrate dehydrogenase
MAAAQDANASVPMGAAAESLYQAFANGGHGGLDFSAIIMMLEGAKASR